MFSILIRVVLNTASHQQAVCLNPDNQHSEQHSFSTKTPESCCLNCRVHIGKKSEIKHLKFVTTRQVRNTKKAGLSNNDWKTFNRTLATPRVDSAALTLTLWAALKQGYCIGTCLLSTPYTLGFPAVRALTPTWWSQHGVVKIHGLHSGCHVLTVCLQQAAVCQSLSCQT